MGPTEREYSCDDRPGDRCGHHLLPPHRTDPAPRRALSLTGIDGKQERESEISDYDDFYERLRASGEAVTTSQPSVGDFISVYEPLLAAGREIVSVHISAGISGTRGCESGDRAADQRKKRR